MFLSIREDNTNLFVANLDDGSVEQLTDLPGIVAYLAWSPDGRTIAFTIVREREFLLSSHIAVVPVTGGEVTQLTNDAGLSHQAAWSPDSTMIAYTHVPEGRLPDELSWIAVVPAAGGDRTLLTDNNWGVWNPAGPRRATGSRSSPRATGCSRSN